MRPLSYRQRLFVEYYLGESAGCAVDAARRAGHVIAKYPKAPEARVAKAPIHPMGANRWDARLIQQASTGPRPS